MSSIIEYVLLIMQMLIVCQFFFILYFVIFAVVTSILQQTNGTQIHADKRKYKRKGKTTYRLTEGTTAFSLKPAWYPHDRIAKLLI